MSCFLLRYGAVRRLLAASATIALLLAACAQREQDDTLARNCGVERTEARNISLCLPTGWTADTVSYGEKENYIVFIRKNGTGSVMQIHVKRDVLDAPVKSTKALAERAVESARDAAPGYEAVSTDPITIDRKQTVLHIFDAKPEKVDEPVRYYQFLTVHAGLVYGITAVMQPGIDDQLRDVLIDVFTNIEFV